MLKWIIWKHTQIKVVLDNMAYLLEKGFGPTICWNESAAIDRLLEDDFARDEVASFIWFSSPRPLLRIERGGLIGGSFFESV